MYADYAAAEAATGGVVARIDVVEGGACREARRAAAPSAWTAVDLETRPANGDVARHAAWVVVSDLLTGRLR